jgi:hypothetical protein
MSVVEEGGYLIKIEKSPDKRRKCWGCRTPILKGTPRVLRRYWMWDSKLLNEVPMFRGYHSSCFSKIELPYVPFSLLTKVRGEIAKAEGRGLYMDRVKKMREEIATFTSQEQGSTKTNLS